MDAHRSTPACMEWALPEAENTDPRWNSPMSAWQQGRCAYCGYVDTSRQMARDHDHATGLIRGLLCSGCNTSEGIHTTPAWDLYRSGVNPATILGIHEVYRP